jgi:gluconokinase
MVLIVMGVAGAGKSTLAAALAHHLNCRCEDADRFHSPENIAKMLRGEGLTDADRAPWLDALNAAIREWDARGDSVVLACSALKRDYRQRLGVGIPSQHLRFAYLAITPELAAARLRQRTGHYASDSLVASQFAALEPPDATEAITLNAAESLPDLLRDILAALSVS